MPQSPRSPPTSPLTRPVSPFPPLAPILSRFSQSQRQPIRDDGYDNFPPPLPHDAAQLERRLTTDPDVAGQMGFGDDEIGPPPEGGREAWSCVAAAFFVLFTFFGFCESIRCVNEMGLMGSHFFWDFTRVLSGKPVERPYEIRCCVRVSYGREESGLP